MYFITTLLVAGCIVLFAVMFTVLEPGAILALNCIFPDTVVILPLTLEVSAISDDMSCIVTAPVSYTHLTLPTKA